MTSQTLFDGISRHVEVPTNGCFIDSRSEKIDNPENALNSIWFIGGAKGWYYGDWLWGLRGFLDKLAGGVGLRRGRKIRPKFSPVIPLISGGVLLASREEKRLLLYAEMKLPGEAMAGI